MLSWGKVALEITTNDQCGLTELDFVFAQKINELLD
ncbi:4a-hydroxytetrahydrobiopterin dehydratase [Methanobacterium sp.]|nr:4a-hydroxytetrahydrobiopterin dehydratase [Methanobacterium sp.]MBI5458337.1 4a-hydroxytetrahydrobiopterin dehydratase [Methanobacterium sp.]MDY9922534.1 4a-hydroxytetrahydrobiopterin dehydratase [Methanobacterium sp.]